MLRWNLTVLPIRLSNFKSVFIMITTSGIGNFVGYISKVSLVHWIGPQVLGALFYIKDVISSSTTFYALQWRHNGRDSVSNHQPHYCLLNRLFRRRSTKTSKLRVTGLCAGNSPGTGEFPAQMASNAENASIWWRHHGNHFLTRRCHDTETLPALLTLCARNFQPFSHKRPVMQSCVLFIVTS